MTTLVVLLAATAFAIASVFAAGDGKDDAAIAHAFMSLLLFGSGIWGMLS